MKKILKKLGLGDSYTSFTLGLVVVVVVGGLLILLARRGGNIIPTPSLLTPAEVEQAQKEEALPKKHIVAANENLWQIAEKYYQSGYNWTDIAKANNLTNPDVLFVGTELVIPAVAPKVPAQIGTAAQSTNPIQGDNYTVVKGDDLWNIAVRAYGDGFKWVEVAKANNLVNPDLIHAGNVLKLPR